MSELKRTQLYDVHIQAGGHPAFSAPLLPC